MSTQIGAGAHRVPKRCVNLPIPGVRQFLRVALDVCRRGVSWPGRHVAHGFWGYGQSIPIAALGAAVPVVAGFAAGERPAAAALLGIFLALIGAAVALAWAIAREPVSHYQGVGIGVALTGAVFLTGAA